MTNYFKIFYYFDLVTRYFKIFSHYVDIISWKANWNNTIFLRYYVSHYWFSNSLFSHSNSLFQDIILLFLLSSRNIKCDLFQGIISVFESTFFKIISRHYIILITHFYVLITLFFRLIITHYFCYSNWIY